MSTRLRKKGFVEALGSTYQKLGHNIRSQGLRKHYFSSEMIIFSQSEKKWFVVCEYNFLKAVGD